MAWSIIVLAILVQEAATAVLQPALSAWIFGLTQPEDFAALSGWQQAGGNLANLLGPTAGGILVAVAGIPGTILAGGLAAVPMLAAIAWIRGTERHHQVEASSTSGSDGGFLAGLHFLRGSPGLFGLALFFTAQTASTTSKPSWSLSWPASCSTWPHGSSAC